LLLKAPLAMAPDLGGRAVRPGAFAQRPPGMGLTGFGHRPLLAPRPRGRFRRDQSQAFHACSGGTATGAIPNCRSRRDGHSAWHTAQSLEGLNHWVQTPRLNVIVPFLCETLEACSVFVDRADVCLKDNLWRRCGTAHLREPPEMGRAPVSPAG